MAGLIGWGIVVNWKTSIHRIKQHDNIFLILLVVTPLTTLLVNIRISADMLTPLPNLPVDVAQPVLMVFFALPIVLAGGLVGAIGAAGVGLASGLVLAFYGSHTIFTLVETAGLGLVFGIAVGQNFRTPFYRFIRHPLGAAFVVVIGFIPVYLVSSFFAVPGILAERFDFALTQNWVRTLARSVELLLAGGIGEIVFASGYKAWYRPKELVPSPSEASLQTRFLHLFLPASIVLMVVLIVGDWLAAGQAARRMVESRLSNSAKIAANSLPYFLETGQSLVMELADPELLNHPPAAIREILSERIRTIPYFRQLTVFDANRQPLTGYPQTDITQLQLTPEEEIAVNLALQGVLIQTYTVPPFPGENSAQITFIAAIDTQEGVPVGVLLGRTDLDSNPFTRPALNALEALTGDGGEAFIIDENRKLLFHTLEATPLTAADQYVGRIPEQATFFEDVSTTGTRQLVFYQPVIGRPWAIVATLPALIAQQITLEIAIPMMAILFTIFGMAFLLVRFTLGKMAFNLQKLSNQASLIAHGQLGSALDVQGVDEIGRLGHSFEQMRTGLKTRLEELNKLLEVSQGVAANLEVNEAIKPILKGAFHGEAVSARIVLIQEVRMDVSGNQRISFGIGPATESYAHLDNQIFDLMRTQDVLTISNTRRVRRMFTSGDQPFPQAMIAFGVYFENTYFGALWLAYERPRTFAVDEVRFLSTLTSETALAAANSRLYASAEVGRRRLEAVLASAPEPVLVFDEKDHLLLLNSAAMHIPGLVSNRTIGRHAKEVLSSPELVKLITGPFEDRVASRELELANGRIFHGSVAPVLGEEKHLGKVCVLRDITHYKEIDTIKSDFVTTVSHDLRTPLTLMRGYSTMLTMVGELNEQQKNYVNKMVTGIENMSHLVNNLLDLGRIEAGISLNLEEVSPAAIAEKVIKQHYPQAAQKNISLVFEPPQEGKNGNVVLDVALMQQALINLVENAIKYTPSKGQVRVCVREINDRIIYEVHDNGIGIAPLDLPRVFEKFYRSEQREAYQHRGTGLGLAIVKSIVDRHQGRVYVESHLGKGSSFFIELPNHQRQPKTLVK